MRVALIAALALATGAAVAQVGLVAFVGLVAPHLVRAVVKPTHGWLVLLASLMGGALLMAADVLARWLMAPQELPVGVRDGAAGRRLSAVAHASGGAVSGARHWRRTRLQVSSAGD